MRTVLRVLFAFTTLLLVPASAWAQAAVTGVVKDASGAVLPGVTVEAASPALIEKVRSAVTDGTGQYRIVDLRPGTYTRDLHVAGFSTVKREGIELTGSFTATINADLRVGTVQETITVTGETPIVDVQSVRRQTTVTNDTLTSHSDRAFLGGDGGADSGHRDAGRQRRGRPGHAADDGVRRHRAAAERGTHAGRRPERRRGAQRRRRLHLHRRHQQCGRNRA